MIVNNKTCKPRGIQSQCRWQIIEMPRKNSWLPVFILQISAHECIKQVTYLICNIGMLYNTQSARMFISCIWAMTATWSLVHVVMFHQVWCFYSSFIKINYPSVAVWKMCPFSCAHGTRVREGRSQLRLTTTQVDGEGTCVSLYC